MYRLYNYEEPLKRVLVWFLRPLPENRRGARQCWASCVLINLVAPRGGIASLSVPILWHGFGLGYEDSYWLGVTTHAALAYTKDE
jgi:hypothetical protein